MVHNKMGWTPKQPDQESGRLSRNHPYKKWKELKNSNVYSILLNRNVGKINVHNFENSYSINGLVDNYMVKTIMVLSLLNRSASDELRIKG